MIVVEAGHAHVMEFLPKNRVITDLFILFFLN
jgi:hypothetical protein